ncbi:MAG: hypothetical protein KGD59_14190 [Candidatus Heimdallarchaeota archaeon]|nr:hypothetical protein [Candidatus Heimdallarchaeota archaeon]MBY8995697.1 hypothetical protein [Candidatus Heimdallarchaeota archaeon]
MATKGKIQIEPPNNKAIFSFIIFTFLFFGLGITFFVLMLFEADVVQYLDDFVNALISGGTWLQYWWVLVVILVGLAVIGFLVGWLLLVLTAKYGHILVIAGSIFFIVGSAIGGLLVAFLIPGLGILFALPGLIPAALMLFVMIFSFNKIRRAGEFLKFTGKVVLAEKGMILSPLFVTFISVLNFLTIASIYGYFIILTEGMALPWLGYVLGTVTSLIQMIIYYGIFYASEAINTTYAYEWYRKRDPDMKFCLKNVLGKAGPILTFGIVTALVQWIQSMLRNAASRSQQKGNVAGMVLAVLARILASLMGIIFKYLTYFTLPAIVIEGHGFKDGVKRSFNLLKRYYMDVLIRETGVSRAFGILQFIAFFLYGVLGAIAGMVLHLTPSIALAPEIAYPLCILSAVIFAFIPTFFIFRPMKTAYLTFVFAYAQDEETGFSLPTRMPKDLQGELKDARKSSNKERSIAGLVKD